MIKNFAAALCLVTVAAGNTMAAENPDVLDTLRARLDALAPGLEPDSIEPSPVEGIYQVSYGAQILYISADGRYLLRGSLVDLDKREDLTETASAKVRLRMLDAVDEDQMIVFSPAQPRHTISVFTDIDCGYCRKLHAEIDQYLAQGIKVRYLAFPRAGVASASYDKAVDVWCAQDKKAALTSAKLDQQVADKTCDNTVKAQYALGQALGVSGTPAIVLENGEMIPGYQPARPLAAMLDKLGGTEAATAE
ncbi:MAG: DsbC family protein [Gammaproteobacteria bacterium]|nr:DsbC family protein [Gammaproteobacteria bacterium]